MSEREEAAGRLRRSAEWLKDLRQRAPHYGEQEQALLEHARACAAYSGIADGVRR